MGVIHSNEGDVEPRESVGIVWLAVQAHDLFQVSEEKRNLMIPMGFVVRLQRYKS